MRQGHRQTLGLVLGLLIGIAGLLVALLVPAEPTCPEGWHGGGTQGQFFCVAPGRTALQGPFTPVGDGRLPTRFLVGMAGVAVGGLVIYSTRADPR
jgi:hypothetical protein